MLSFFDPTLMANFVSCSGSSDAHSRWVYLVIAIILIKILLALIPANIAKNKGYKYADFYIIGLLSFCVGLIIALCLSNKAESNTQNKTHSNAEEIEKYYGLFQKGIITEEEYEAKKKELLRQ